MNTNPEDRHKPVIDSETKERWEQMHRMKSPDDLDPMDSEQIELTRLLEQGGDQATTMLILNMGATFQNMMQLAKMLPLTAWQRALFELDLKVRRGDTSQAHALLRDQIWIVIQFFQKLNDETIGKIGNQSVNDLTKAAGDSLPPIEIKE